MITYRATLDVPTRLVNRLTKTLARLPRRSHRRLSPREQAIAALIYLRKGDTFAAIAAGFGIAISTCHHYINEAINAWRRRKRPLRQALATRAASDEQVVVDGTIIPIDRLWHRRGTTSPFYSGKRHCYGLNVQALTTTNGRLLWLSDPLPGAIHDITAARHHRVFTTTAEHYLLADLGYLGAGPRVLTGFRRPYDNDTQRQITIDIARRRACGERPFAALKTWRCLRKLRISPNQAWRYIAAIATCIQLSE